MKINIIINESHVLKLLAEINETPPKIPNGKNTIFKHIVLASGYPAIVCNQSGFRSIQEDNGECVNGLSLCIALVQDKHNCPHAPTTLERWLLDFLEVKKSTYRLN